MIASVIEDGFEADDGIAREHAVGQALHEALLDGGDVLLGHRAAHDLFRKLKVSLAGLEADLAVAVLAVAARLLLVFPFRVGGLSDGLLIGDGGGAEVCLRAEFRFQLLVDDVKMHFALAARERFARVVVLDDDKAPVLFRKAGKA